MEYTQAYNPLNSQLLSTVVAAIPILVLFWLLVVRRVPAHISAASGALAAIIIAVLVYRMPAAMAGTTFVYGAMFALLPICWTIVNAMFLYNVTVETGRFEQIKNSVAGLSADHRLQAVLIAFSFGAFLEGAAGGGTPVAICAAMLVGLGFNPFLAAGLCLIANTSPVAYGGFGTPLLTLASVTGLDVQKLSNMAGNQLPMLSCIVPFWLVRCMCGWKDTFEVLPAIAVAGGSFAICQFVMAHSPAFPLTDIVGGLLSLIITAAFLCVWKPKKVWRYGVEHSEPAPDATTEAVETVEGFIPRMKLRHVLTAWMPFIILSVLMTVVGTYKDAIDKKHIGPIATYYEIHMPNLDKAVIRTPPVVEKATHEPAVFKFNWLTTPGTSVFVTVLITLVMLRIDRDQFRRIAGRTFRQMCVPVITIVCMIGLGYVTRYGGMDATLGMAFMHTGAIYPFFAAILGWLGVFLTGTDAGSNALFGSLQRITALQLGLSPILITVANSTGGVMGKMIDAQSICVATAATDRVGSEADIFKWVVRHSVILAAIVGIIVMLQAYVPPFTSMVPR